MNETMSLANLAAFAVAAVRTQVSRVPIYKLGIEEARAKVNIKDGNRKANDDGSVALVLGFGKRYLPLDIIAENATRITASATQVEEFTAQLQGAVDAGMFDEVIVKTQGELEVVAAEQKAKMDAGVPPEAVEALDLDALTDPVDTEEESELL